MRHGDMTDARQILALLLRLRRRHGSLTRALVAIAREVHPELDTVSALARYLGMARSTVRLASQPRRNRTRP